MGTFDLAKSTQVYILVGQEGGSACRKNFAVTQHYSCGRKQSSSTSTKPFNPIKELQNMEIVDGGGGGGGGTFVYVVRIILKNL